MMTQLKQAFHRSQDSLAGDALGATALVIMLFVGLHLPGLI